MNSVSKFQNLPASEGGTSPLRHPPVHASTQLALTRHREAHQLCPPGQSGLATPLQKTIKGYENRRTRNAHTLHKRAPETGARSGGASPLGERGLDLGRQSKNLGPAPRLRETEERDCQKSGRFLQRLQQICKTTYVPTISIGQ